MGKLKSDSDKKEKFNVYPHANVPNRLAMP
jgi:hypothetical protein